ncbi:hypothetical protein BJV82DRAFT_316359 [Fennellomyces sp. T-0311]|nr:hypothetical protein BJV82DRAFT_316359 [Fennellomyces sp. T-0311]
MVGTTIQSHHLPQYRGAQRLASKKQRIPGILPVDQALPYTWASTDKSIYQANHPSYAQCSIHSRYLWIRQASMQRCTNLTIRLISQNQEQALSICTASSEGQEASNEPSRLKSKDAAKKKRKKSKHIEAKSGTTIMESHHPTFNVQSKSTSKHKAKSISKHKAKRTQTLQVLVRVHPFQTTDKANSKQKQDQSSQAAVSVQPSFQTNGNIQPTNITTKKKNRCIHCIFAHICIVLANAYCPSLLSFHPIILPAPLCLSRNKSLRTNEYPL